MKNFPASDNVYISKSKIHNAGRGVFARRDIKKDDEITVYYYNGNPKKSPLWFEVG